MKVCSTLKFGLIVLLFASIAQAQSIDISKFYYRDYLDFGQNKGAFSGNGSTTITGKDGAQVSVPNVPNFSASSNYGSLTSVGRGFAVTANHVSSPESQENLRKWGLTTYEIAKEPVQSNDGEISGTSKQYGYDEKFLRLSKYVVEGQVGMLDISNSIEKQDSTKETQEQNNKTDLINKLKGFDANSDGNVYIYQAGSGIVTLRGTSNTQKFDTGGSGEMKGGGFGYFRNDNIQYGCEDYKTCNNKGMWFYYYPNTDFNNRITSGDSGSGIYAYDKTSDKWVLVGVVSKGWEGQNRAFISVVSQKDFIDYQKNFEQKIDLKGKFWTLNGNALDDNNIPGPEMQGNKDIIFSSGGTIQVEKDINRAQSGYAGGFVFVAEDTATSTNPTTYKFTNANGKTHFFKGSGLDIGENVKVEWALKGVSGDSLHKIGKGELVITTKNTQNTGLGTLKIGEGKVTLDTTKKAFENIYITSGRGELALKAGKAEALGAEKSTNSASGANLANSYKLAQENTNNMGFYFGTGGGKFDLAGNSLVLNTIAANDSKAIITNSSGTAVNLEIEGLGYDTNGKKMTNKADTIIHASFGEISPSPAEGDKGGGLKAQNSGQANINIKYSGNRTTQNVQNPTLPLTPSAREGESQSASLIFDGHINIKGKLEAKDGNIVLQGHPTTHATISEASIRDKIKNAESGTSAAMPNYMDLSKPSNLNQPDWDNRTFKFGQGITLTNSALTLGRNATLEANINATNSSILFGANAKHFIDNKDGANINGSGFGYFQQVESGFLSTEQQQIANYTTSYKGTITADGTMIESHIFDLNASLNLKNKATLSADFLTLTNADSVALASGASASIKALRLKDINNDLSSKFKFENDTKFEVKESFIFDKSTFDLDNLKTTNDITLPEQYNLYAANSSNVTATTFTNSNANAKFMLDNSTFKADKITFEKNAFMALDNKGTLTLTNGLQSANLNLNLSNSSTMSINSFKSTGETSLIIRQGSTLKTTGDIDLNKATIQLTSENSSLNAKNLTLNEKSSIILDDKATLTLENALSSKDLTLTLKNESKFTAKTLTASGVVKLQGDKNATLALETLNLNNGNATLNANGSITTLNLSNVKDTAIGENVSITTLKLTDSTANLQDLKTNLPQSITLNEKSNLYFNELNLNTNSINLTSDDSSKAHIQRLIYDAKSTQTNGANKTPQSNLSVSELFKLDNVGKNLGTTQNTQGAQGTPSTEQDKLNKDLLTLEFSKNLELKDGAKLDISFADKVTKDNPNLIFDKDYKIFSASTLTGSNLSINFTNSNGASFNETNFFATGRLDQDNNAFFVQFVRENPRNFGNLNPHIKNPAYSPLLEILLQHNKNDASIDKAVNMSDYTALNQRLAQIDTSLKTIANADSAALKTLPLLQKQEINARIQQNRFTTAKFALAKITNPAQKSDIVPTLLYLDENERQNRVWSGASASFFSNDSDKFSLQSVSIGYDRKLFGDEFLLGILASLTNTQLSSDETSLNPKIYTLALYSDALFRHGELQNELSFSLLNGDKGFESENGSYKSFYGFFESVYKVQTAFLPQSIKPIVLGRVNLRHFDEFSTATYKQKADDDISVDLGVGVEWLWQKESGFYSASFVAERDIYHSQKERLMSLTGAQKFVAYETNEPSFAYQLYLAGLENFKSGIYLRYGLSGFVDSKAYKGFKADVQVGYRF